MGLYDCGFSNFGILNFNHHAFGAFKDLNVDPRSGYFWLVTLTAIVIGTCFMRGCILGFARRTLTTMAGEYVAGSHSMAFVTVPNMEVAKKLSHGIVMGKYAACVNIIPAVTSVYEWEGKVEEDSELILMIKTRTERVADLSQFVRENHPYDVAEVISSKIEDGNAPYLKWIGDIVPASTPKPKV